MMIEFCDKDDAHVGFYTTNHTITSFIATTGTTLIDVQPDGTITNNILSADVSRAMTFLEGLCRDERDLRQVIRRLGFPAGILHGVQ